MTAMYGIWRSMAAYGGSELFFYTNFVVGKQRKRKTEGDDKAPVQTTPDPS